MIKFDRLWNTLDKRGITKEQFAEENGISIHMIHRLEKNEIVETILLNKLCNILSCDVNEIAEYVAD